MTNEAAVSVTIENGSHEHEVYYTIEELQQLDIEQLADDFLRIDGAPGEPDENLLEWQRGTAGEFRTGDTWIIHEGIIEAVLDHLDENANDDPDDVPVTKFIKRLNALGELLGGFNDNDALALEAYTNEHGFDIITEGNFENEWGEKHVGSYVDEEEWVRDHLDAGDIPIPAWLEEAIDFDHAASELEAAGGYSNLEHDGYHVFNG